MKARPLLRAPALLLVLAACSQPAGAHAFAGTGGQPSPAKLAPASIAVSVESAHPGAVIPSSFLGLSMETPVVESPAVTSSAPALARLMRQLGPGVLRISGVSVDRTQWMAAPEQPAPWRIATITPADLRNLSSLMSATGWGLLLGLNLGHPLAQSLVEEARAATAILGNSLAGLAIGNEPDLYTRPPSAPFRSLLGGAALRAPEWGLSAYETEITGLRAALAEAGVHAALYGPDTAAPAWLEGYAAQQGGGLTALAQHFYPLGRCHAGRLLKVGPSLESLLSLKVALHESRRIAASARVAASHGLPLRIDEANSVSCAGQPHTSDTFAAALWAVDFSLIAAREGVVGVNFHGGLGSCSVAGTIVSPWYSPLCFLPSGQLHARPEYYALLLLRSLEGCAFVPAAYRTTRDIAVYALRAPDGSLRVVIDDKEAPAGGRLGERARPPAPAVIALRANRSFLSGSVVRLSAPSASAEEGVRFGGASVGTDGSFAGAAPEALAGAQGSFLVTVRPASVAVVTLAAGAATGRRVAGQAHSSAGYTRLLPDRGGVAMVSEPVTDAGASAQGQTAYAQASPFQRFMRRFAASGPGSWMFARVLHHIDRPIYRLTRGKHTLASLLSGLPVVMLTTTGARSGVPRTVSVVGLPTPDGLAVIASNFGQKHHPGWYHNLRANPAGQVKVHGATRAFHATVAEGETRARIWQEGLRVYPGWSQYERRASHRRIAIFVLGAPAS